jgi:hypothetical protein
MEDETLCSFSWSGAPYRLPDTQPPARHRSPRRIDTYVSSLQASHHDHHGITRSINGDTVEISQNGRLLRVHAVKHDPVQAHGAFANPGANPTESTPPAKPPPLVVKGPEPSGSSGYRNLTT